MSELISKTPEGKAQETVQTRLAAWLVARVDSRRFIFLALLVIAVSIMGLGLLLGSVQRPVPISPVEFDFVLKLDTPSPALDVDEVGIPFTKISAALRISGAGDDTKNLASLAPRFLPKLPSLPKGVAVGDAWDLEHGAIVHRGIQEAACLKLFGQVKPGMSGKIGLECFKDGRGLHLAYRDKPVPQTDVGYWPITLSYGMTNGAVELRISSEGAFSLDCADPADLQASAQHWLDYDAALEQSQKKVCLPAFSWEPVAFDYGTAFMDDMDGVAITVIGRAKEWFLFVAGMRVSSCLSKGKGSLTVDSSVSGTKPTVASFKDGCVLGSLDMGKRWVPAAPLSAKKSGSPAKK